MFESIRNVYCVGRNYKLHAEELGNALTEKPMLFMKPTHALVPADGRSVTLPADQGLIHFETEVVLHVGRRYEPGIRVDELIDKLAIGIDLTLREVQDGIKKKGQPWLACKGFLQSAPIGDFRAFPGVSAAERTEFTLEKNGQLTQRGKMANMIFSQQTIIDFLAAAYGLGEGDIIFTGTPEGVGAVQDGDRFQLKWGNENAGEFTVRLGS